MSFANNLSTEKISMFYAKECKCAWIMQLSKLYSLITMGMIIWNLKISNVGVWHNIHLKS